MICALAVYRPSTIDEGFDAGAVCKMLDDVRGSAWHRTEMIRVGICRALELTRFRAATARGPVG